MKKIIIATLAVTATLSSLLLSNGWADNTMPNTASNTMAENNQNTAVNDNEENKQLIDPDEQYALAMSHQPMVEGEDKLQQEAEGFRQLSPQALANIRAARLGF